MSLPKTVKDYIWNAEVRRVVFKSDTEYVVWLHNNPGVANELEQAENRILEVIKREREYVKNGIRWLKLQQVDSLPVEFGEERKKVDF
jgi:hypothetical protein